MDILVKAKELVDSAAVVSLSVVDRCGFPTIYRMEKVLSNDLSCVVLITRKESDKVSLLSENQKCCIGVDFQDDAVCLKGTMEIIGDSSAILSVIPKAYADRLIKGGIEKFCVMRFNSQSAEMYIEGEKHRLCSMT